MFSKGKGTVSPSIPRKLKRIIKDKLQVPIAAGASSDISDEWTDEHNTSDSSQEWADVEESSKEGDDVEESSKEVSDFTSEDDYSPVEQLRCEEFSSGDNITDRIVIPSSKSLLDFDSDDFEYLREFNPVAASTQIFPEATFYEDEIHHFRYFKNVKPVNESTALLPEAPFFEDVADGVDYFKLNNPKASSSLKLPETSFAEEEIEMMGQLKPLTSCRNVEISSIATVSLPFETNFESDIEHTPPKNKKYLEDKETSCLIDATIVSLNNISLNNSKTSKISSELAESILKLSDLAPSNECSISNIGSRSLRNVSGSVIEDLQEEIGSKTNSFFNSLKRSRQKLSNIQRKGTISNSIIVDTKLKDISNHDLELSTRTFISTRNDSKLGLKRKENVLAPSKKIDKISKVQPENQTTLKEVAIRGFSNKQNVQRTLKVMKPFYRSDVPIDVLCYKEMKIKK